MRVKCAENELLHEFATICSMCNDSSVDYNEVCYLKNVSISKLQILIPIILYIV